MGTFGGFDLKAIIHSNPELHYIDSRISFFLQNYRMVENLQVVGILKPPNIPCTLHLYTFLILKFTIFFQSVNQFFCFIRNIDIILE